MAGFEYGGDVGVPSYHELEAFCRQSGTDFSVSSSTGGDHGNTSYHYTRNAIDVVSSAGSMQALASWLVDRYAAYMLEVIHSGGPGYFVKNGKVVAGSYYGAATISEHYNHVHIAATLSGINAASGSNPTGRKPGTATTFSGSGCAIPVATAGLTLVTICGGFLCHLL